MTVVVRKRLDSKGCWTCYLDIYDRGKRCLKYLSLHYRGDRRNKEIETVAEVERQKFIQQQGYWCPVSLQAYVTSEHYAATMAQRKKMIRLIETYGDFNIPNLTQKRLSAYFCQAKKKMKAKRFYYFYKKMLDVLYCMYQQGFITVDYATQHRGNVHKKNKIEVQKHVG